MESDTSHRPEQTPLVMRIRDLAATRMRYGYFRIYILLRREGWLVNHKRVYRLYREDGLSLRLKKPRRNVSAANRERQPAAAAPNEMWSMDFVSDALFDGQDRADTRGAKNHPRGQWPGAHLEGARPLGGAAQGSDDAQHSWKRLREVRAWRHARL